MQWEGEAAAHRGIRFAASEAVARLRAAAATDVPDTVGMGREGQSEEKQTCVPMKQN